MSDRFFGSISAIVNRVMRRVDYLALYPGTVRVQDPTSLAVDVDPDSDRLGSLSEVPVRSGVAGVSAKVAPGARVLIGFDEGDPKKPFASLWEGATALELTISAATITLAGNVSFAGGLSAAGGANDIDLDCGIFNNVNLGTASALVARQGDTVQVDPITHIGTITVVSQTKVKA